jgi:predicted nucleotide-binding protein
LKVDVFISHASEDKDEVARPLAEKLQELGLKVWLDEFSLKVGDSLRASIDRGLSEARFGVAIISPHFLAKKWPQHELAALVAKETGAGAPVLLPVWHNITAQEVLDKSPILADRLAVSTNNGIEEVAKRLAEAIVLQTERDNIQFSKRIESAVSKLGRKGQPVPPTPEEQQDEVFIVHGHDLAARESVARFIEKIGAKSIVLDEQASRGRTIIEKFEQHANVKFAVVLLTPDDAVHAVNDPNEIKYRARQNVVFEMGFFLGKLGRKGLCVLHKGNIEFPSDVSGIVYIELDSAHGWRISLARELKQAGVRIDLNRVLE